jgi:succinoglycan biosynthesis protein ExoA
VRFGRANAPNYWRSYSGCIREAPRLGSKTSYDEELIRAKGYMESSTTQCRAAEVHIAPRKAGVNTSVGVSVVMPVLNEARFIEAALRSLQAQLTPGFELEMLVVDGISDDTTQEKVAKLAAEDPRIKLLHNPLRHTPAALNIGLRAATGHYVCIMGAHASYDADYISVCLQELLAHGAVGCSGKIITAPADSSRQALLVAWALGHPLASSSRSVRTQAEGYADTLPFPVLRKQALLDAGGYNELLIRNQDNDMNQRLRVMGFKLYLTTKTQCRYYPRSSVKSFLKHAFISGLWNALTLKTNPASLGLRHFAPVAFVTLLLLLMALALTGFTPLGIDPTVPVLTLAVILAGHLGIGAVAAVEVALREKTALGLWLAPLILAFHCSYGLGTLRGLLVPAPACTLRAHNFPESSKDPA